MSGIGSGHIATQPVSGTITANAGTGTMFIQQSPSAQSITVYYATRSDTYTSTGNGTAISITTTPLQNFAVQVKGTGAAATSWDVRLEGSLDGTNFTQILAHTQVTGDGVVLYSGSTFSPSLYIRSRAAALVLGAATNIVVTIVGQQ